ncbi:MAG: hypothetical protein IAB78_06005 [Bacteroidetes bacterium]|uniref:Tetratricopeptide repeat protein n=1 Tax=Candidatus Cryptobacteroides excrementavium TaxID=2840759 RepID=A0A9D9NRM3_9BACT|nr:hypothetical protein [Candidatus Cryptobacteroides excrementavium]
MKRIFIALAVLLSIQTAGAQVKTPAEAKRAVESATVASQNPKKAVKVATWMKLAKAYVDAYDAPAGNAWIGAGQQELKLIMANEKPVSVEQVTLADGPYTKEVYADKNLYYNASGVLAIIEVTKPVFDDALVKAYESYLKAYEVDLKKSKFNDVVAGIKTVSSKYLNEGMNAYMLGDLGKASEMFAKAADVVAAEPVCEVDTTATYYAGFTAWMNKDYAHAKDYFEACIEASYFEDGEVYAKLADCQLNLADTTAAKTVLEEGFAAFPQNQSILIGLINFYLESGDEPDRLFELLDKAKENEPNNASLYYVEGNIHKELGEIDQAVASYLKSNEINPEYEFGLIGIGILYYEQALDLQEQAQNEFDDAKYMELVSQFETVLKKAIEPFEKAFNVTKDEGIKVSIAEYLKNIFYRFRDQGQEYSDGYKKYDAIVASGRAS